MKEENLTIVDVIVFHTIMLIMYQMPAVVVPCDDGFDLNDPACVRDVQGHRIYTIMTQATGPLPVDAFCELLEAYNRHNAIKLQFLKVEQYPLPDEYTTLVYWSIYL